MFFVDVYKEILVAEMSALMSTPTCAREANDLTLGASHDGAGQVPQAPVMPIAEVRISFDRECETVTADELMGCVAFVTATSVQVMGLDEYETACGTRGKPSGVKPIRSSTSAKSTTSDSSAAKLPTGKQGKRKGYCPPPRSAGLMQLGLLPTQTIGQVVRVLPSVAEPLQRHAVILRGFQGGEEDWEIDGAYFVDISVEDFTCAMCGFAGARDNPMAAPDKIIAQFSPVYDEKDLVGLDKLQRLVVIGMYLFKRDVRKDKMREVWSNCDKILSKRFLCFTEDKVLDVSASFDVLCTILELGSDGCIEVSKPAEVSPVKAEEPPVYGPLGSRRMQAIAEQCKQNPEPVLPVTIHYRAMPVVERVTHCPVQPSGGASNATKTTEAKPTGSFKVDEKILMEERGLKMVAKSKSFNRASQKASKGRDFENKEKDSNISNDIKSRLTPAQLSGYASEGLSTLSYILKNAEKFPENIIQARTGKVLKTMLDDEPFAAYLSGCTAANSSRNEIYRVLCVIADKAWTKGFKTSLAMFFRDMVLDVSAFEVYLAGVSEISKQTKQRAAMDSLRELLTDFKFVSSTVVVSNTAASVVVEAPPVEVETPAEVETPVEVEAPPAEVEVMDEGFM